MKKYRQTNGIWLGLLGMATFTGLYFLADEIRRILCVFLVIICFVLAIASTQNYIIVDKQKIMVRRLFYGKKFFYIERIAKIGFVARDRHSYRGITLPKAYISTIEEVHNEVGILDRYGCFEKIDISLYKNNEDLRQEIKKIMQQVNPDQVRVEISESTDLILNLEKSGLIKATDKKNNKKMVVNDIRKINRSKDDDKTK